MSDLFISHTGRSLLNRRAFLKHAGTGLGGVALATLLAEERLRAADRGRAIRPQLRPEAPFSARPGHFHPRAKNVLVLFCSGACSHLDTWDYKPELIKRHGQALPGGDKLITFQGEQGSLTRSPYDFKPRG